MSSDNFRVGLIRGLGFGLEYYENWVQEANIIITVLFVRIFITWEK